MVLESHSKVYNVEGLHQLFFLPAVSYLFEIFKVFRKKNLFFKLNLS